MTTVSVSLTLPLEYHYGVPLSQVVKLAQMVLIVLAMYKCPVHNKYAV